jgi:hypothetical protein
VNLLAKIQSFADGGVDYELLGDLVGLVKKHSK